MASHSDSKIEQFSVWLDLSHEELETLLAINSAISKKIAASEKAILTEKKNYDLDAKEEDVKSTLLSLTQKGLIDPTGNEYKISYEKISSILKNKGEELMGQAKNIKAASESVENFFSAAALQSIPPIIKYLPQEKVFATMTSLISTAKTCYFTTNFPNIAYTRRLAYLPEMKQYIEVLQDRCFKGEARIIYFLRLRLGNLFNTAMNVFKDHEKAYLETLEMVDTLEDQIDRYPNLDIRYIQQPFGLDGIIFMRDEPEDFLAFIRDAEMEPIGALYMRHPPIVARIEFIYHQYLKETQRLEGEYSHQTFKGLREDFEKKYQQLINN
ncbi:MAG: hypothetical protein ABH950_00795 [Candidatus Altiarchaeota archaeon]